MIKYKNKNIKLVHIQVLSRNSMVNLQIIKVFFQKIKGDENSKIMTFIWISLIILIVICVFILLQQIGIYSTKYILNIDSNGCGANKTHCDFYCKSTSKGYYYFGCASAGIGIAGIFVAIVLLIKFIVYIITSLVSFCIDFYKECKNTYQDAVLEVQEIKIQKDI
jgi:hypothetical protein